MSKKVLALLLTLAVIGTMITASMTVVASDEAPIIEQIEQLSVCEDVATDGESGIFADDVSEVSADDGSVLDCDERTDLKPLVVRFLDIGAGDCAVLECDGHYAMIDAGAATAKGGKVEKPELYPGKAGIEEFDYLILSHPHSDHIGKVPKVLKNYHCNTVIVSAYKEKASYKNIKKLAKKYNSEYHVAATGEVYPLGDAVIEILYVPSALVSPSKGTTPDKLNNSSIILRVRHGERSFLFTGDALITEQARMLENNIDVKSDVVKVPHHGHKNAYWQEFYDAISPFIVVVSSGKAKANPTVLKALGERYETYHTYKDGTVTIVSDGMELYCQ